MTMTVADHSTSAPVRRTRLWLPLPLSFLWVLLAPFAMVLSLFAWVAPPRYRVNGPAAAIAIGSALFALSGTLIEIKSPDADIFILIF
jgi:polyferredoxin